MISRLAKRQPRSLAKIQLEGSLKLVNDFYWGASASIQFAESPTQAALLSASVLTEPRLNQPGRFRQDNISNLLQHAQSELPKFGVILLFSYFEPYLRDICLSAILSNPGILNDPATIIDGESIATDESLLSTLETLATPMIEQRLKRSYAERFGQMRQVFGLSKNETEPFQKILDNYYAKRNCLVHKSGMIDLRAHRFFEEDSRNPVGGRYNR